MKTIDCKDVEDKLSEGIKKCLTVIEPQTLELLKKAQAESEGAEKWCLDKIVENACIAESCDSFACQDTGLAVIFLQVGQDARISGGLITDAINEGVRRGYAEARKSVAHPLTRLNTHDNTPAIIHTEIVAGDGVTISYLAKGAGSENMGKLYMLTPSKGRRGIIDAVVDCVATAGGNPCPPIVVGVGIGGNMEKAALLAKKALLRPTGTPSEHEDVAAIERDALASVNALGIGAQGLGGRCSALSVAAEVFPTHIGMLPVCVCLQCHSVRHFTITF